MKVQPIQRESKKEDWTHRQMRAICPKCGRSICNDEGDDKNNIKGKLGV
jgi:ribosomal protein S27E